MELRRRGMGGMRKRLMWSVKLRRCLWIVIVEMLEKDEVIRKIIDILRDKGIDKKEKEIKRKIKRGEKRGYKKGKGKKGKNEEEEMRMDFLE